jgi:hypothetical protein
MEWAVALLHIEFVCCGIQSIHMAEKALKFLYLLFGDVVPDLVYREMSPEFRLVALMNDQTPPRTSLSAASHTDIDHIHALASISGLIEHVYASHSRRNLANLSDRLELV